VTECSSTAPGGGAQEGSSPRSSSYIVSRIKVQCELETGHDGPHSSSNGALRWHDPPLLLIDGKPPELEQDSEHWVGGEIRFSWQEPAP
jgi:hypothetical protein